MERDGIMYNKRQLETKYFATKKDIDNENIKNEKNEIEILEKYKYFSDKIIEVMIPIDNIYKEYIESDNLKKIKNSDKIYFEMKKFINNIEIEELKSFINKLDDNYEFNEEIKNIIKSDIKQNLKSFINNIKVLKKSNALKRIGEIKSKFEFTFPNQIFDIVEYEQKIDDKIKEIELKEEEINDINNIISKLMLEKFKEIINNEYNYILYNLNINN